MGKDGDDRSGEYERPTTKTIWQRKHWSGAHEQPIFEEGKGRLVWGKPQPKERISWTFIGIVGLIAAFGGTAIGIGMARTDTAPVEAQVESVVSAFPGKFSLCHVGGGYNCVVDGDTIWLEGQKIRVLGIDAPETHPPRCRREAELGEAATRRLRELLNSGPVTTMQGDNRDRDTYGRLLRHVLVNGEDVGDTLVAEGLARPYGLGRRSWC